MDVEQVGDEVARRRARLQEILTASEGRLGGQDDEGGAEMGARSKSYEALLARLNSLDEQVNCVEARN